MSKCKVCGYRLGDGVKKCPMCGAVAGSTVAGNIKPDVNLQKSFCPSCGADLKNAGKAFQQAQQNVVVQKDKAKPNKTAFVILSAVTVIFVIHNEIWQLSKGESLFYVIFSVLFFVPLLICTHYIFSSSKSGIIFDSIGSALFLAIELFVDFSQ